MSVFDLNTLEQILLIFNKYGFYDPMTVISLESDGYSPRLIAYLRRNRWIEPYRQEMYIFAKRYGTRRRIAQWQFTTYGKTQLDKRLKDERVKADLRKYNNILGES